MARNLNAARILTAGLMTALAFGLVSLTASAQQFINISYPGAAGTYPNSINNHAEIVGDYVDSDGLLHGFYFLNARYTALNVPASLQTAAAGINDLGEIVGVYQDSEFVQHGFLFNGLTYTTIDYPGAVLTRADNINNLGQIVGTYANAGSNVLHGFTLKAGVFTPIDAPGSSSATYLNQINNFGVIGGGYIDANSISHGFVYNAGTFTAIEFPGASNTAVTGINDSGEVSGVYCDPAACTFFVPGPQKYFTEINGQYTTVDVPTKGEIANLNLELNNAGQLVSAYQDSGGGSHGAVSAIGPFAYVTTGHNSANNLLVFDAPTGLEVGAISIPGYANEPASTPDQKHVYVTCGNNSSGGFVQSNEVCVVDVATDTVVNTIPVGNGAFGIAITPDGSSAYVANYSDSTVSVINIASGTVTATIPVGANPLGVAITPNGQFAYISFLGGVSVISTTSNQVLTTISPVEGGGTPAITPNGDFVYVNSSAADLPVVTVISTATNTVTGIIGVGSAPINTAISSDGSTAYVPNISDNTISIIDTDTQTVIATISSGGNNPGWGFLTPDGSVLWALNTKNIAEISTMTNSIIALLPYPNTAGGAGIFVNAPPTSQSITQPLNPTAPNQFNFGPHNFTVQYPPGTSFSGVNMTVVAAQATQASIQQRLAGTPFANAACIVYSGTGGNCVDYQVTCSNTGGSQITCPSEASPTITVKTSFDTLQPITNPGFLTTPIGTNNWTNIFDSFYLQRIDPTMKGKTSGFSEFLAVDLGTTNSQGAGTFQFLAPLQTKDERIFPAGTSIPVSFQLTSVTNPAVPVSDAIAGITVVMISDANGNATANLVFEQPSAFTYSGGSYIYSLNTSGYAPGTYNITVYGNAFVAQQVAFTVPAPTSGARISTTLQSLTLNKTTNQYVAVFKMTNTGTGAANGLTVTASNLNSTASVTALPVSMGDVNPAASVKVTLSFPASAGAPKSSGDITISESYAGGTSGGGFRVTLP